MSNNGDFEWYSNEITKYLKLRYEINEEESKDLIEGFNLKGMSKTSPTFFFWHSPEY